jgi:lysophospholipase L1-like esterase
VAITAILLEFVTRFALGIHPLTKESVVWAYDPELGWWQEPGKTAVFVKLDCVQPIQINSHGLRERAIDYAKPVDVFRILVLGDSITVGFEVPPEKVFTRVLEDRLNTKGLNVEVINGACRGWGTDQSLIFLQREGLKYHPDLVLYCYAPNDPLDNTEIHRPFRVFGKSYFVLDPSGMPQLRNVPVPDYLPHEVLHLDESGEVVHRTCSKTERGWLWLRDNLACRSAACTLAVQAFASLPMLGKEVAAKGSYVPQHADTDGGAEHIESGYAYRLTLALVKSMQQIAESENARFAVCEPAFWNRTTPMFAQLLEDLGEEDWQLGRQARELLPKGASPRLRFDAHFSAAGHQAVGEAIAECLVTRGLVPGNYQPTEDTPRLE